jgi:hypothetical protein
MSPGERRILEFISARIESMLRRPSVWGSLLSIEERLLQLLELRRVLLVPTASAGDTQRLMKTYVQFIAAVLDDATAEPLAIQLERRGRSAELTGLLARFVQSELAAFLVEESGEAEPSDPAARTAAIDMTARVLESLRMDAEARAQRRPLPVPRPIEFPEQKKN